MFLLYGRHNAQRNMTTDYAAAALFGDVMVRWLELCSNPCQHLRLARRFRYYIFICIHTIYYNISRRVVLLVLLDWEQQPHTEILFFRDDKSTIHTNCAPQETMVTQCTTTRRWISSLGASSFTFVWRLFGMVFDLIWLMRLRVGRGARSVMTDDELDGTIIVYWWWCRTLLN